MSQSAACGDDGDLVARFLALSELLRTHQDWWRPRAFFHPLLSWEPLYPQLAARLRQLPVIESERIAADNNLLLDFFGTTAGPLQAAAMTIADLCVIDELPLRAMGDVVEARDVPGRKWQQILAFTAALPDTTLPATEWCAGKAHLARHYARLGGAAVVALEYQRALVDAGNAISRRESLPVLSHCVDVLQPAANDFLRGERLVLALHACGQLHLQLLHGCAVQRPRAIALAPCCYQLQDAEFYAPLSRVAQAIELPLHRLDLHTPSQPLSILHNGFQQFCIAMAQHGDFLLSATTDFPRYETLGQQRLIEVTALDLPRMLFRRALELWLVLDRALYLQESGYRVRIGTFCERVLTPRNLLIQAWHS